MNLNKIIAGLSDEAKTNAVKNMIKIGKMKVDTVLVLTTSDRKFFIIRVK